MIFATVDIVNDACCVLTIKLVPRFLENEAIVFYGFVGNSKQWFLNIFVILFLKGI